MFIKILLKKFSELALIHKCLISNNYMNSSRMLNVNFYFILFLNKTKKKYNKQYIILNKQLWTNVIINILI